MVKIVALLFLLITLAFSAVNINRANAAQLQTLNGIGPSKAQEIIKYRKAHGGFKSVDELVNVNGIGPKTVQKLKPQVTIR
ncbi:ComEA family DNA-binding protein [Sulfuricurvum sp.]|uniref:ComEA family DNA-binding protein n=1 Tax=Sulfuricurvum sp. TaxID=2025608 RepID=UPI0026303331|nr:helix-hairpin-helix domain-containing protein [Sulfuricurvum sp.]MDD2266561.1 helix-hairpin-helix domain-containing protein [Sulfuricurvum sp.]MDD2783433.1 helix-hairpin-helix domain-containing protein [Sulfuricurvum sp.]HZF69777.1 helix-hairpin-helix domain-containing protein [Sulfuricurvum sp.]